MSRKKPIPITELIVERMERYRFDMKLTQAEFADKIGISLSGYKKILHCDTNYLMYERYVAIAVVTQKVFWVAYFLGEPYVSIADLFDQYDFSFEAKIKSFLELVDRMKVRPPSEAELEKFSMKRGWLADMFPVQPI